MGNTDSTMTPPNTRQSSSLSQPRSHALPVAVVQSGQLQKPQRRDHLSTRLSVSSPRDGKHQEGNVASSASTSLSASTVDDINTRFEEFKAIVTMTIFVDTKQRDECINKLDEIGQNIRQLGRKPTQVEERAFSCDIIHLKGRINRYNTKIATRRDELRISEDIKDRALELVMHQKAREMFADLTKLQHSMVSSIPSGDVGKLTELATQTREAADQFTSDQEHYIRSIKDLDTVSASEVSDFISSYTVSTDDTNPRNAESGAYEPAARPAPVVDRAVIHHRQLVHDIVPAEIHLPGVDAMLSPHQLAPVALQPHETPHIIQPSPVVSDRISHESAQVMLHNSGHLEMTPVAEENEIDL